MRLLLFLVSLVSLSSCSHYVFNSVQSASGVELSEIPSDLRGDWKDSSYFIRLNEKMIQLKGLDLGLSDSVRLFKCEDYYLLNIRNNDYLNKSDEFFSVFIIKKYNESTQGTKIWEIEVPWNAAVARKMKNSLPVDYIYVDSMGYVVNGPTPFLLNYNLKIKDLKQIEEISNPSIILNNSTMTFQYTNNRNEEELGFDNDPKNTKKRRRLLAKSINKKEKTSIVDESLYQELKNTK